MDRLRRTSVGLHCLVMALWIGVFVMGQAGLISGYSVGSRAIQVEFTAAVYEHIAVWDVEGGTDSRSSSPAELMAANLDVYATQIKAAKQQRANIVVFPEYGLTGLGRSRQWLREAAERVPDPTKAVSNPCAKHRARPRSASEQEDLYQFTLSCLAAQHDIYVVANVPSWESCDQHTETGCREDGYYLYNTNVVYDNRGQLVHRYRKWTLYYEYSLDQPATAETNYFDTPFGRFASFVCFDVLFEKPAIDLVKTLHIDTALFPTAWQSKFPLMQGVGFHESWSILTGVNLLSSELHLPEHHYAGSGINAGGRGAAEYYYDPRHGSPAKLLIATIPSSAQRPLEADIASPPALEEDFSVFDSIMRGDVFSFVVLTWKSYEVSVGQQDTTCYLQYQFKDFPDGEIYALAVFQGLHHSAHNSYLQVCALVKCGSPLDLNSCGDPVVNASAIFDSFTMTGQFSTEYVFPSVVVSGGFPTGNREGWDFTLDRVNERASLTHTGLARPIVYATLYGRVYGRDGEGDVIAMSRDDVNSPSGADKSLFCITVMSLCCVLSFLRM